MVEKIFDGNVCIFYRVVEKCNNFFIIAVATHSHTHRVLKVCSTYFVTLAAVFCNANLCGFIEQFCRFFFCHSE